MTEDKYKGKYRIPSARWQDWDYGVNAAYFVTVCTAQREHFFGEITGGEMQLSTIGQTAHDCWTQIPAHFPFVVLDTFVIMPNHVHGIIVIDKSDDAAVAAARTDAINRVSTIDRRKYPKPPPNHRRIFRNFRNPHRTLDGTFGNFRNHHRTLNGTFGNSEIPTELSAGLSGISDAFTEHSAEFSGIYNHHHTSVQTQFIASLQP
jgi:REP element-mobilizing transposase RayT